MNLFCCRQKGHSGQRAQGSFKVRHNICKRPLYKLLAMQQMLIKKTDCCVKQFWSSIWQSIFSKVLIVI